MARTAISNRVATTRNNSILYNGAFEVVPPVNTDGTSVQNRWVDGTIGGNTAKLSYGWGTVAVTLQAEAKFDTTVFRSGTASMKLSTGNAAGAITLGSYRTNSPTAASLFELFPLSPNAVYKLNGYIRTNNVATNGAFIELREFTPTGSTVTTNTSNKLSGTDTSWRNVTVTFTTGATTRYGGVFLRNNVVGNTSDAWFDDITVVPALSGRVAATGRVAV